MERSSLEVKLDKRYYYLLSLLWNGNVEKRLGATSKIVKYGTVAVGPLTRRILDTSEFIAQRSLATLKGLGYGEGAELLWVCRKKPSDSSYADLGAYLSEVFTEGTKTKLQQAAIIAGISGFKFYVPNVSYALARSNCKFARRALAEAMLRLRDLKLLEIFRYLTQDYDPMVFKFAIHSLVYLNDRDGVKIALDHAKKLPDGYPPSTSKLLEIIEAWLNGRVEIPEWYDKHRHPKNASKINIELSIKTRLEILEWEIEDLPEIKYFVRSQKDYILNQSEQHNHYQENNDTVLETKLLNSNKNYNYAQLWSDGSWDLGCAGWGIIVSRKEEIWEYSGSTYASSSVEAEMLAVIYGLNLLFEKLQQSYLIDVITDCALIVEGMKYRAKRWQRTNWFNSQGKTVANLSLWIELLQIVKKYTEARHKINWKWTKGHAGTMFNERADKIAKKALKSYLNNLSLRAET